VLDSDNKQFANIFDRSFFKLRHLSIGYDPAKRIDFGEIKSFNVSLFGYNLLIWKKAPYTNPDFDNDNDLQDPGARRTDIPLNVKL
jgi:hypothetical protein